eukprot:8713549-Lingulodinium_polyedra.AAC.1
MVKHLVDALQGAGDGIIVGGSPPGFDVGKEFQVAQDPTLFAFTAGAVAEPSYEKQRMGTIRAALRGTREVVMVCAAEVEQL